MNRTNQTKLATISALLIATLLLQCGCRPATNKDSGTDNATTTEPSSEEQASSEKSSGPEPDSDSDSVLVSGDLNSVDWPSMVGQEITIKGNLVVVDTYDLIRRGQVKVARERLYVPTSQVDPNDSDPDASSFEGGSNVANVTAAQKHNDNAVIILDDGSADQNIFPPTLFPKLGTNHETVRAGSLIKGVSGKLVKAGNKLLLVSNKPLQWTPAPRPQRPDVGPADVTVASLNVLNYFTTIDNGDNDARGADSKSELERQEAKLVSAIIGLQADVIGLMEIENNLDAEKRLVAALNKTIGKDAFKGCGLPDGFRDVPGGNDSIRVGIIYRADRVETLGLVSTIRNDAFQNARAPIVQKFKPLNADSSFAVVVNHFKSKGGASNADVANKNKGDGQGAYNAIRRSQSLAICNYLNELKQDDPEPRVLVIGDLNAYGQEDPIDAMRAKGLVDLRERFSKDSASNDAMQHYSYTYFGQCGSLDHAMATSSMAVDVTGIATWHINADEPRFLDYNQEYNPKTLYEANPFRSSDHDPVLIGIRN